MGFWCFLLVCNLLLPVIMIVAGRLMWKHCPKEINGIYGYRTRRSRINEDTWKYAHEYCGKLWWKLGFIMLIPTIITFILFINSSHKTIGTVGLFPCIIQCIIMIATVFATENALKKAFTDDGMRR